MYPCIPKLGDRDVSAMLVSRCIGGCIGVVGGAIHVSRLYCNVFRVRSLNTCLNTSRYITIHVSESKLSHIREQTVPHPPMGNSTGFCHTLRGGELGAVYTCYLSIGHMHTIRYGTIDGREYKIMGYDTVMICSHDGGRALRSAREHPTPCTAADRGHARESVARDIARLVPRCGHVHREPAVGAGAGGNEWRRRWMAAMGTGMGNGGWRPATATGGTRWRRSARQRRSADRAAEWWRERLSHRMTEGENERVSERWRVKETAREEVERDVMSE